jgi:rhamnosyl/mannosyltransferase
MRILMAAPYFYPRSGGLEMYVHNLSRFLVAEHGHEVAVVCSFWEGGGPGREDVGGIRVHRLPFLFKVSTTPVNPSWFRDIEAIVSAERPDVINGHTPVPYISDVAARVARKTGIPFILTCHDTMAQSPLRSILSWIYFLSLGTGTMRIARRIIVNSPQTAKSYHSSLEGSCADKVTVIPPGVDTAMFHPVGRAGKEGKVIFFAGQLYAASRKGLDILIRALPGVLAECPDARLLVAGPGPTSPYECLVRKLGVSDRVEFLGNIEQSSLPRYYNMADVFVLPSRKRAEGFGMSLIEAQACRTPVIGSRVGGIPYAVLDGETGLLVPSGDPAALSRAIIRLLTDGEMARRLSANGYDRVRREFTWEMIAAKTSRVYEEVTRTR